jgi:hypothetical protein
MLPGPLAAGTVHKNASHGLGRRGEEMATAVPVMDLFPINQPQLGFVHQGGGLQRLARLFLGQHP